MYHLHQKYIPTNGSGNIHLINYYCKKLNRADYTLDLLSGRDSENKSEIYFEFKIFKENAYLIELTTRRTSYLKDNITT